MYAGGETAAAGIRKFARRFAGQRGEDVVLLASRAIRGVALGVVVTALVQALLGGLGLAIAGVPFASVLTAAMLLLCLAQVGPTLVLLPATLWMFYTGDNVWGTVLAIWTVIVGTIDNFIRPVLIKQGRICRCCSSSPASSAASCRWACSASSWVRWCLPWRIRWPRRGSTSNPRHRLERPASAVRAVRRSRTPRASVG
jgi:hypothetical protein